MSDHEIGGHQKQTRRRAVRLRPDALELLKATLAQTWAKNPGPGKFTREEKANLLGVSVATSQRILKGEGVDRPSLTLAFKNLGLEWEDSYCEPYPAESIAEERSS